MCVCVCVDWYVNPPRLSLRLADHLSRAAMVLTVRLVPIPCLIQAFIHHNIIVWDEVGCNYAMTTNTVQQSIGHFYFPQVAGIVLAFAVETLSPPRDKPKQVLHGHFGTAYFTYNQWRLDIQIASALSSLINLPLVTSTI